MRSVAQNASQADRLQSCRARKGHLPWSESPLLQLACHSKLSPLHLHCCARALIADGGLLAALAEGTGQDVRGGAEEVAAASDAESRPGPDAGQA